MVSAERFRAFWSDKFFIGGRCDKEAKHLAIIRIFGWKPYAENQVMRLCADITALKRDTGFEPRVPFRDGIRETVAFCRMQKNQEGSRNEKNQRSGGLL